MRLWPSALWLSRKWSWRTRTRAMLLYCTALRHLIRLPLAVLRLPWYTYSKNLSRDSQVWRRKHSGGSSVDIFRRQMTMWNCRSLILAARSWSRTWKMTELERSLTTFWKWPPTIRVLSSDRRSESFLTFSIWKVSWILSSYFLLQISHLISLKHQIKFRYSLSTSLVNYSTSVKM